MKRYASAVRLPHEYAVKQNINGIDSKSAYFYLKNNITDECLAKFMTINTYGNNTIIVDLHIQRNDNIQIIHNTLVNNMKIHSFRNKIGIDVESCDDRYIIMLHDTVIGKISVNKFTQRIKLRCATMYTWEIHEVENTVPDYNFDAASDVLMCIGCITSDIPWVVKVMASSDIHDDDDDKLPITRAMTI